MAVVEDLRYALRRLRLAPGTTALSIAMLAVAIGVTCAMFTVADHMLLRPAPFRDPSRLVAVWAGKDAASGRPYLPAALARQLRESSAFAAFVQDPVYVVEGASGLASKGSVRVTPGAFEMLGVAPLLGRTFVRGEGRPGSDDLAVIAERVWRTEFDRDPRILGRRVPINGRPVTVAGVMPEAFRFPYENVSIWRPLDLDQPPAGFEKRTWKDTPPASDVAQERQRVRRAVSWRLVAVGGEMDLRTGLMSARAPDAAGAG